MINNNERTEVKIGQNDEGYYIYKMDFDENNNMSNDEDLLEGIETIDEARKELKERAAIETEEGFYSAEWQDEDGYTLRATGKTYEAA